MRRSKKQPEYDPNELADLIQTPAVGSGVGSHLLTPEDPNKVTTVVTSEWSSIATSILAPGDTEVTSPIVPGRKSIPDPPVAETPAPDSTVVISELCPVVEYELTTVVEREMPIEVESNATPVVTYPEEVLEASTVVTSRPVLLGRLWISESGEIVPESRVRRVTDARDALSSAEAVLYLLLWSSESLRETPGSRSVQAGYESLIKRTGFSRKTIQRTIDRLTAKQFIEIETQADIYRRTPTIYRVFGTAAVLERLARYNRTHIAKIGPGVAFVTPLTSLGDSAGTGGFSDLTTVVT